MNNGLSWDAEPRFETRAEGVRERYLRQPVRYPCACGLRISALPTHDGIIEAVRAHQRTAKHRAWFAAAGW